MVQNIIKGLAAVCLITLTLSGCGVTEQLYKEPVVHDTVVTEKETTVELTPAQTARLYNISYEKFLWKPTEDLVVTVSCPKFYTPFKYSAERTENAVVSRQVVANNNHENLVDEKGKQQYAYSNYILDYVSGEDYADYEKNYLLAELGDKYSVYFPKLKSVVTDYYLDGTRNTIRGIAYQSQAFLSDKTTIVTLPYYSVHFLLPNGDYIVLALHTVEADNTFEQTSLWEKMLAGDKQAAKQLDKSLNALSKIQFSPNEMISDFLVATLIGDYSKQFTPAVTTVEIPNITETTEEIVTEETTYIAEDGVIDSVDEPQEATSEEEGYNSYNPDEVYYFE